MNKIAAYRVALGDHPLWGKEANFVDTPYGKVHEDDHDYLAGHLSLWTDLEENPKRTRENLIRSVSSAKKPEYREGLFPNFRREAKRRYHEGEVASWKRMRSPKYLKRAASDFAANGQPGVF